MAEEANLPDWLSIDEAAGTISIYHVTYSIAMFEKLAFGATGKLVRLTKRKDNPNILEATLVDG